MKKLTNLQKKKRLERSRRDTRVRKLKKYSPLCISKGFIEYALHQKWDDEMVDAAALVMHYYFMNLDKINERGWIPMPHQIFENMFGRKYRIIKDRLLASGFLQYNQRRKYRAGSHCSEFRICDELRNDRISASYRLQFKPFQEIFIAHKEYRKRLKSLSAKEYQKQATHVIESAFETTDAHSYYWLVEDGYLTVEQFQTIKRLAVNAHSLKLSIDDATIERIATERYKRKYDETSNDEFEAYVQWLQSKVESTFEPRISICRNSRFYIPMTNIPREFWDYVYFGEQQLVGVDTRNSHVVCLLALIKDISVNYFGATGTYKERLSNCQFSKQINSIPGLREHLRISSIFYQPQIINCTNNTIRGNPFIAFTRYYTRIMKQIYHKISYNKITESDYRTYLQSYTHQSPLSVQLSIPHSPVPALSQSSVIPHSPVIPPTLPHLSTLPPTLPHSPVPLTPPLPPVLPEYPLPYPAEENVGFCSKVPVFQGVMRFFHAYHFSVKPENQWNKNTTRQKDNPIFRNCFFPSPEEISELERLLESDFYARLMEAIGTDMGRNDFKGEFFHFLYRPAPYKPDTSDPVREAFKALLPSILHLLDLSKCKPGTFEPWGDYYKWISRAMISLESKIMLECCANLWKKYPDIFLATVHDCIKCLPQDVEKVQEELKRTYAKYQVFPKFDVKHHKKPSNPS